MDAERVQVGIGGQVHPEDVAAVVIHDDLLVVERVDEYGNGDVCFGSTQHGQPVELHVRRGHQFRYVPRKSGS
ncbi:hypothetical protein [Dietzia cinnamea]|uniref:hypothetical protein n=1 Tax=Dietzia cinnamea TaxID=321318 RepID=UPI0021A89657|nr:hypothetical protein [Dietzia cinnamea]MCT2140474.1 hypothetical protein [Dietzia cinnamea]